MWRACRVIVAVSIIAGCNSSGGEPPIQTAPVDGVATYQGKPLEGYRVFFYSTDSPAQQPSSGRVDSEGRFTLSTREADDGAIIGKNNVWLTYDPDMPPSDPDQPAVPIPPPSVKIPETYTSQETSGMAVDVPEEGLTGYKLELK